MNKLIKPHLLQSKTGSKHLKHFTFVFQELQEMIEKHRSKNEAWLRARAEENDRERRELCSLRVSKHVTSAFFHFLHSCYVWLQHRNAFFLRRRFCRSRRDWRKSNAGSSNVANTSCPSCSSSKGCEEPSHLAQLIFRLSCNWGAAAAGPA